MNSIFYDRIKITLAGRKIHPWGARLGISRGTLERMKKGGVPTHESLTAISRFENVSTRWLLEGRGTPYYVTSCLSGADALEYAKGLLNEPGWICHQITDGDRYALALVLPGQYAVNKRMVSYTILELMTGNIGIDAMRSIAALKAVQACYGHTVSRSVMMAICEGKTGTYQLLLSPTAILHDLTKPGGVVVEVKKRRVESAIEVTDDARVDLICKKLRKLDAEKQAAVETMIDAMLPQESKICSTTINKTAAYRQITGSNDQPKTST